MNTEEVSPDTGHRLPIFHVRSIVQNLSLALLSLRGQRKRGTCGASLSKTLRHHDLDAFVCVANL